MENKKILITNDELDELINTYLIEHHDEIIEMINNKIRIAINKTISDAFKFDTYNPENSGYAYLQIQSIVKKDIKPIIKAIKLDTDDIKLKINNRMEQLTNKHIKSLQLKSK